MEKINLNLKEIGSRLKNARKAISRKQLEVAKMCGLPKSTISEMENGLRKPHTNYLLLLVSEFNVNLNWIFTGKGAMFADYEISWDFGKDNQTLKDMLYLIENSPDIRLAIFKFFVDLIKENTEVQKVLQAKESKKDIPAR